MPEKFDLLRQEQPEAESEAPLAGRMVESAELETNVEKPLSYAELKQLDWQMGEYEGQPMMVAENVAVPQWYQDQGFDQSEHRRPAILMVGQDGHTLYRPSWVFFVERNIHQPLGETSSIEGAEAIIARYQEAFESAESAEELQKNEEQMLRADGLISQES